MARRQSKKKNSGKVQSAKDPSPRLADYEKIGPVSIEGVEASDLPDKGRGDISTNPSKEAGRRLPQQTGQWDGGDTGLRGDPDIADANQHGGRRKN